MLINLAKDTVGVREGTAGLSMDIRHILIQLELVNRLIAEIEHKMEITLNKVPCSSRLLSIKGLGVISVGGIIGEVGDFKKFRTQSEIMKLAGLDLYEISSGKWKGRSRISKRGRSLLNDRVLPFFEAQDIPVLRVLTDRGTEYCGSPDKHPYELYLQLNNIEHTKTKVKSPQTNDICERVHQTILNEFYRVTFRKKVYSDIESLQVDLDEYMDTYNRERTHQGKRCQGRTPMDTFLEGKKYFDDKNLKEQLAV
jgi:hypothetical protein